MKIVTKLLVRIGVVLALLAALTNCDDPRPHRYLYVVEAPFDRDGFRTLKPSIEVHDIEDGHRLVRTIALPADVMQVRGVAANAATGTLYISHFGRYQVGLDTVEGGKLLAVDIKD